MTWDLCKKKLWQYSVLPCIMQHYLKNDDNTEGKNLLKIILLKHNHKRKMQMSCYGFPLQSAGKLDLKAIGKYEFSEIWQIIFDFL